MPQIQFKMKKFKGPPLLASLLEQISQPPIFFPQGWQILLPQATLTARAVRQFHRRFHGKTRKTQIQLMLNIFRKILIKSRVSAAHNGVATAVLSQKLLNTLSYNLVAAFVIGEDPLSVVHFRPAVMA